MENLTKISSETLVTETLGNRMKRYEAEHDNEIPSYHAIVVRSDGHDFSSLTRHCKKPFDVNFIKAMAETMQNAVKNFNSHTGYVHSSMIKY